MIFSHIFLYNFCEGKWEREKKPTDKGSFYFHFIVHLETIVLEDTTVHEGGFHCPLMVYSTKPLDPISSKSHIWFIYINIGRERERVLFSCNCPFRNY